MAKELKIVTNVSVKANTIVLGHIMEGDDVRHPSGMEPDWEWVGAQVTLRVEGNGTGVAPDGNGVNRLVQITKEVLTDNTIHS